MPSITFKLAAVNVYTGKEIASKFLSVRFTPELVDDMNDLFELDAVSEIAAMAATEICNHITPRLVEELMKRVSKKGNCMEE